MLYLVLTGKKKCSRLESVIGPIIFMDRLCAYTDSTSGKLHRANGNPVSDPMHVKLMHVYNMLYCTAARCMWHAHIATTLLYTGYIRHKLVN